MIKKSVLALALFAGLLTSSSAFAGVSVQADYSIVSARLTAIDRAEVTVRYRGLLAPQACPVTVRFLTPGGGSISGVRATETLQAPAGLIKFTGGEWSFETTVVVMLPYAQGELRSQPSKIFYFQAMVDAANQINEYASVSMGSSSWTTPLEGNNAVNFTAIGSMLAK